MTISDHKPTDQDPGLLFKSTLSEKSILHDLPEDFQAVLDHVGKPHAGRGRPLGPARNRAAARLRCRIAA